MSDEIIIKNLAQFVEVIGAIKPGMWSGLFFRGHANRKFQPEPGIFRENGRFLKHEKDLFNDIITQCPEEFKDCHYTFEYLVKMQHYGLPTRLLDITSNALVALYFACCDEAHKNQDGQLLVFEVLRDMIKNYNSDTVSVLSNLVYQKNNFSLLKDTHKKILVQVENEYNQLHELCKNFEGGWYGKKIKELALIAQYPGLSGIRIVNENEERYKELKIIELFEKVINIIPQIFKVGNISPLGIGAVISSLQDFRDERQKFLHFIKQEKGYFIDKLRSNSDLQKIICVRAKLNNPRIIRQNGLFLLFGMGKTKGEAVTLFNAKAIINEYTPPKIIIAANAKETILQQLRAFGISQETLMPEIETVAKSLKENLYKRP